MKEKLEEPDDQIRVISTFKADNSIVSAVKKSEESFKRTPSFRNLPGTLFKYVKKVAPNVKSQINSLKNQALGTMKGGVVQCKMPGCKCCKMLNCSSVIKVNHIEIRLASGSCKTYNIIYLGVCILCEKPYTGRTVGPLHKRVNGHRHSFKEILKKSQLNTLADLDETNELYALGLHLHLEHGCSSPSDFDRHVKFAILEVVNPSNIEVKEYKWMHKLNSFQPLGINVEYPFGLPYLGLR